MISISKTAIPVGARAGTIVGAFTAFNAAGSKPAGVRFQTESDSLFGIDSQGNLIVSVLPVAGFYAVHIYAVVGDEVIDEADFVIEVT